MASIVEKTMGTMMLFPMYRIVTKAISQTRKIVTLAYSGNFNSSPCTRGRICFFFSEKMLKNKLTKRLNSVGVLPYDICYTILQSRTYKFPY